LEHDQTPLFGQPGMPARLAIFFADTTLFFSFNDRFSSLIISESTEPTFVKFSGLVELWYSLINLSFILQFLKGLCHGNQF